jgi:hypothetical protein
MYAYFKLCKNGNHIGGVMVSVLASSAVNRGFEPRSGKIIFKEKGGCACYKVRQVNFQ